MKPFLSALAVVFSLAALLISDVPAYAGDVVATSTFEGRNKHVVTGTITITKNADGTHTVALGDDFSLDGAPDPKVAFGDNDKADPATFQELLKSKTGAQTYVIPASIDPTKYSEAFIWCEKFSVSLGAAKLK